MKKQGVYHGRGKPFPEDVSSADVERFVLEGNSAGPKLASNGVSMRLEWFKSTKRSAWNARAVSVLSAEFHSLLKAGKVEDVKYDSKTMTLKFCEKQITQRVDKIRRERIAHEENKLHEAQQKTDQTERRRGRRKTVSPEY